MSQPLPSDWAVCSSGFLPIPSGDWLEFARTRYWCSIPVTILYRDTTVSWVDPTLATTLGQLPTNWLNSFEKMYTACEITWSAISLKNSMSQYAKSISCHKYLIDSVNVVKWENRVLPWIRRKVRLNELSPVGMTEQNRDDGECWRSAKPSAKPKHVTHLFLCMKNCLARTEQKHRIQYNSQWYLPINLIRERWC